MSTYSDLRSEIGSLGEAEVDYDAQFRGLFAMPVRGMSTKFEKVKNLTAGRKRPGRFWDDGGGLYDTGVHIKGKLLSSASAKNKLLEEFETVTRSPLEPPPSPPVLELPVTSASGRPGSSKALLLRPDEAARRQKKKHRHKKKQQHREEQQERERPQSAFMPATDGSPSRNRPKTPLTAGGAWHRQEEGATKRRASTGAKTPEPRRSKTPEQARKGSREKQRHHRKQEEAVRDEAADKEEEEQEGEGRGYDPAQFHGLPMEQKLAKLIEMREECIDKLKELVEASGFNMRDGRAELVQLLQLTRRLSLHVVSVLDFWRKNCEKERGVCLWQGSSYLSKMCSDTDFLAEVPYLEEELGVCLLRNPFFGPLLIDGSDAVEALTDQHQQHEGEQGNKASKHRKLRAGDPVVELVDPLANSVDVRTNLRIQRACRVLHRELRRSRRRAGGSSQALQEESGPEHPPPGTRKAQSSGERLLSLMEGNPNYPTPKPAAHGHASSSKPRRRGGHRSAQPQRGHIMQFFSGEEGAAAADLEDDALALARLLGNLGPGSAAAADTPAAAHVPHQRRPHHSRRSAPTRHEHHQQPPPAAAPADPPSPTPSKIQALCNDALGGTSRPWTGTGTLRPPKHEPALHFSASSPSPLPTPLTAEATPYHVPTSPPYSCSTSAPPPLARLHESPARPSAAGSLASASLATRPDPAEHPHLPSIPAAAHATPPRLRSSRSIRSVETAEVEETARWEEAGLESGGPGLTLAGINSHLDDTLAHMRKMLLDHEQRNRSICLPALRQWRRVVVIERRIRRKAAIVRWRLLSSHLRAWRRAASCRKKHAQLEAAHLMALRRRLVAAWVQELEGRLAKRQGLKAWTEYNARKAAVRRADQHARHRLRVVMRVSIAFLRRHAKGCRARRVALRHAQCLLRGRAADALLRWRGVALSRVALRRGVAQHDTRLEARALAAVRRMRRQAQLHRHWQEAGAQASWLVVRRGMRLFIKLKHRAARRLLVGLAAQAHRRASTRRALAVLHRHKRIAAFARSRNVRSRQPATLRAKQLLRGAFSRWLAWNDRNLTLQLILLFWQQYEVRVAFLRWKHRHGPHPSRLVNVVVRGTRTLRKGAEKVAKALTGLSGLARLLRGGRLPTSCFHPDVVARTSGSELGGEGGVLLPPPPSVVEEGLSVPTIGSTQSSYLSRYRHAVALARREKRAAKAIQDWWVEQRRMSALRIGDIDRQQLLAKAQRAGVQQSEQSSLLEEDEQGDGEEEEVVGSSAMAGRRPSVMSDVSDLQEAREDVASLKDGGLMRDRRPSLDSLNEAWLARAQLAAVAGPGRRASSSSEAAPAHPPRPMPPPSANSSVVTEIILPQPASSAASLQESVEPCAGEPVVVELEGSTEQQSRSCQPPPVCEPADASSPGKVVKDAAVASGDEVEPPEPSAAREEAPVEHDPPPAAMPVEDSTVPSSTPTTTDAPSRPSEAEHAQAVPSQPEPGDERVQQVEDAGQTTPTPPPAATQPSSHDLHGGAVDQDAAQRLDDDIAAALRIQSAWRGHSTRKQVSVQARRQQQRLEAEMAEMMVSNEDAVVQGAATSVQKHWRGHRARQAHKQTKRQRQQAATSVQRHWRGHKTRRAQPGLKVKAGRAARSASPTRAVLSPRQRDAAAATSIQRHWRGTTTRKRTREAMTKGGRSARSPSPAKTLTSPRRQQQKDAAAATSIQRHWRGTAARKQTRGKKEQQASGGAVVSGPPTSSRGARSPSHAAAGKAESALLPKGARPVVDRAKLQAVLLSAIKTGDLEAVGMALAQGADVNAHNEEGETPLIRAVLSTSDHIEELVEALLSHGADIDAQDDMGRTPVMTCLTFGVDEVLPLLLARRAALEPQDCRGRTCFHYSVDEENLEACELLVLEDEARGEASEDKAAVNLMDEDGLTPLHMAVRLGNKAAVEALLRHPRIKADTQDRHHHTPLLSAVLSSRRDLAELLLRRGAQPCPVGLASGLSVLFAVVDREDLEAIRLLLRHGHVNAQDSVGNTLLHWAVIKHSPQVAGLVLDHGALVSLRNADGCLVTDLAVEFGFKQLEDLIARADGRTASRVYRDGGTDQNAAATGVKTWETDEEEGREDSSFHGSGGPLRRTGSSGSQRRLLDAGASDKDGGRPPLWPGRSGQEEEGSKGAATPAYEEEDGFFEAAVEGPPDDDDYFDF